MASPVRLTSEPPAAFGRIARCGRCYPDRLRPVQHVAPPAPTRTAPDRRVRPSGAVIVLTHRPVRPVPAAPDRIRPRRPDTIALGVRCERCPGWRLMGPAATGQTTPTCPRRERVARMERMTEPAVSPEVRGHRCPYPGDRPRPHVPTRVAPARPAGGGHGLGAPRPPGPRLRAARAGRRGRRPLRGHGRGHRLHPARRRPQHERRPGGNRRPAHRVGRGAAGRRRSGALRRAHGRTGAHDGRLDAAGRRDRPRVRDPLPVTPVAARLRRRLGDRDDREPARQPHRHQARGAGRHARRALRDDPARRGDGPHDAARRARRDRRRAAGAPDRPPPACLPRRRPRGHRGERDRRSRGEGRRRGRDDRARPSRAGAPRGWAGRPRLARRDPPSASPCWSTRTAA